MSQPQSPQVALPQPPQAAPPAAVKEGTAAADSSPSREAAQPSSATQRQLQFGEGLLPLSDSASPLEAFAPKSPHAQHSQD